MKDELHKSKIRVLVVAESLLMGMEIAQILTEDRALEVVGRAVSAARALKMVGELLPDVIVLDLDAHKIDGIGVLKHIMVKHPIPTVVMVSLASEISDTAFDALRFGAVDLVAKPSVKKEETLEEQRALIVSSVKNAAAIRVDGISYARKIASMTGSATAAGARPDSPARYVCISAISNGYYSFLRIIPNLPPDFSDVLIGTIPAAPRNVEAFVTYLAQYSAVPVRNLKTVKKIEKGACLLCSGTAGLILESDKGGGLNFRFQELHADEAARHGADYLMSSLARSAGRRGVGLVLGYGGHEGVEGIEEIRLAGGRGYVGRVSDLEGSAFLDEILTRHESMESFDDGILQDVDARAHVSDCRGVGGDESAESEFAESDTERRALAGYVSGIDVISYVEFVLLTGRPTVLEFFSDNRVTGQVYIRNGRVLHAQYGELQGDQALYRCLVSPGGSFLNRPWREPLTKSINKPGGLVLLEAARRRDAAHREWVGTAK
ncbi:MAG: chemotaxis protein CheB [Desulfomonilaceae bacterium]|nr:chemotaxis protein CheB [Desulfomonilaceae bacterium]